MGLMKNYKVLAASWHPSATNSIIPIIKELRKQGKEVIALGSPYAGPRFEQEGVSYTPIENYGLKDFSESEMEKVLMQETPNIVLAGASFQEPIKKEIYITDQTILKAAKAQSIPSVRVQDWWSPSIKYDDIQNDIPNAFLPDKIALMDDYAYSKMIKKGISKEILAITGYPELDNLQQKKKNFTDIKKKQILETLGAQNAEKVFLYAGGIDWPKNVDKLGYWNLDVIKTIEQALKESPNENVSFVMGIHPRIPDETKSVLDKYLKSIGDPRMILVYGLGKLGLDSDEVSLATDATFVSFSTVGVKAAYMGKPALSLQPNLIVPNHFEDGDVDFFLQNRDIIPLGTSPERCVALLQHAMINEAYLKDLEQELRDSKFNVGEGEATRNVISLMNKLV